MTVPAILGTAAGAAGFTLGAGLGLAIGALHGDRRLGANRSGQLACDAALALAGVRLRVTGEANAWSAWPAVFVANHQSAIDPIVVGAILRRDLTGVAKRQLRRNPGFFLVGLAINVTYIDRDDPVHAREDVNRLAERLRDGTSVLIFPEGTRSASRALGPFKKGAFHLALQAKVPIVPIALRNTGELLPNGAMLARPGTADVAVLDPVPTDGWTEDELGGRAADVRDRLAQATSARSTRPTC
jgi:putative phosphoserine phosphatase/1-acylglycerol-3-phosphate O-acyltransferase